MPPSGLLVPVSGKEMAFHGATERSPGFPSSPLCTMIDQEMPGLVPLLFPGTQGLEKQVWQRPEQRIIFARFSPNGKRLLVDTWQLSQVVPHPSKWCPSLSAFVAVYHRISGRRPILQLENLCPGTGTGPRSLWDQSWKMDDLWNDPRKPQQVDLFTATRDVFGIIDKGLPALLIWTLLQGPFLKHRMH